MELNVPAVLEVGPSFFGSVDNNILEGNVITIQEDTGGSSPNYLIPLKKL